MPCECDLRDRRWNPNTGVCETCGNIYKMSPAPGPDPTAPPAPMVTQPDLLDRMPCPYCDLGMRGKHHHRHGCPQPMFEDYEQRLAKLLVEKDSLQVEKDRLQLACSKAWARLPNIVRDAFNAGVVWTDHAKESWSTTRSNAEQHAVSAAYRALDEP